MNYIRKAVVTGGNGYIASVLVRSLLAAGTEVHTIGHHNREQMDRLLGPEFIHLSTEPDNLSTLIQEIQPDVIFHLASINGNSLDLSSMMAMLQANIQMGTALLHGASRCDKKPVFVNTGSYWQFADGEQYYPATFYAATKQSFHDLMLYFSRHCEVRAMTLILYDSFGPGDKRAKLWTKLMRAPAGSSFPLTEGQQYVELVHVEDIADAYLHAAKMLMEGKGMNLSYAVRSENPFKLRDMLEDWKLRAGLDLEFEWGAIPYPAGQVFNPWRGEILPGWSTKINVQTAIADCLRAGRTNNNGEG